MKKAITITSAVFLLCGSLFPQLSRKDTIFFDLASFELKNDSKQKLSELAEFLLKKGGYKIGIYGHTDSLGTSGYNFTLAQNRAEEVMDFLNKKREAR